MSGQEFWLDDWRARLCVFFFFSPESADLFSLKHGAVGGERGAGFVVEFTVTFEEGSPEVPDEVDPIQT